MEALQQTPLLKSGRFSQRSQSVDLFAPPFTVQEQFRCYTPDQNDPENLNPVPRRLLQNTVPLRRQSESPAEAVLRRAARRAVISQPSFSIDTDFKCSDIQENTTNYRESGLKKLKSGSWESLQRWEKENELLFAFIEDECEWLSELFPEEKIDSAHFFESLQDGVVLSKLAKLCQNHAESYGKLNNIKTPFFMIHIHSHERCKGRLGNFLSRENVELFLKWCRAHKINESLLFETNDVVVQDEGEGLRDGAREIVLCLMEVARYGVRFGVKAPKLILLEKEIEEEEAMDGSISPKSGDSGFDTEPDLYNVSYSSSTDFVDYLTRSCNIEEEETTEDDCFSNNGISTMGSSFINENGNTRNNGHSNENGNTRNNGHSNENGNTRNNGYSNENGNTRNNSHNNENGNTTNNNSFDNQNGNTTMNNRCNNQNGSNATKKCYDNTNDNVTNNNIYNNENDNLTHNIFDKNGNTTNNGFNTENGNTMKDNNFRNDNENNNNEINNIFDNKEDNIFDTEKEKKNVDSNFINNTENEKNAKNTNFINGNTRDTNFSNGNNNRTENIVNSELDQHNRTDNSESNKNTNDRTFSNEDTTTDDSFNNDSSSIDSSRATSEKRRRKVSGYARKPSKDMTAYSGEKTRRKSIQEIRSELHKAVTTIVQNYNIAKIIRLKEGKYVILGKIMFVRLLNKHCIVRIGGGWDTLEHYLMTHVKQIVPESLEFEPHPLTTTQSKQRSLKKKGIYSSTPNLISSEDLPKPTTDQTPPPRESVTSPKPLSKKDPYFKNKALRQHDDKLITDAISRVQADIIANRPRPSSALEKINITRKSPAEYNRHKIMADVDIAPFDMNANIVKDDIDIQNGHCGYEVVENDHNDNNDEVIGNGCVTGYADPHMDDAFSVNGVADSNSDDNVLTTHFVSTTEVIEDGNIIESVTVAGVLDDIQVSDKACEPASNEMVSNDATSNDPTNDDAACNEPVSNDVASNDAVSNGAESNHVAGNEVASNDSPSIETSSTETVSIISKSTTTTTTTKVKSDGSVKTTKTKSSTSKIHNNRPSSGKPATSSKTTKPLSKTPTSSSSLSKTAKSTGPTKPVTKTTNPKDTTAKNPTSKPTRPASSRPTSSRPPSSKPTSAKPNTSRPTSSKPTSTKPCCGNDISVKSTGVDAAKAKSKISAPKTSAPKTTVPKASAPKTTTTKSTTPKTTGIKSTVPKTTVPKTTAPKPAAMKTSAPKPAATKTSAPKTSVPKATAPKTTAAKTSAKSTIPKTSAPKTNVTKPTVSSKTKVDKETPPKPCPRVSGVKKAPTEKPKTVKTSATKKTPPDSSNVTKPGSRPCQKPPSAGVKARTTPSKISGISPKVTTPNKGKPKSATGKTKPGTPGTNKKEKKLEPVAIVTEAVAEKEEDKPDLVINLMIENSPESTSPFSPVSDSSETNFNSELNTNVEKISTTHKDENFIELIIDDKNETEIVTVTEHCENTVDSNDIGESPNVVDDTPSSADISASGDVLNESNQQTVDDICTDEKPVTEDVKNIELESSNELKDHVETDEEPVTDDVKDIELESNESNDNVPADEVPTTEDVKDIELESSNELKDHEQNDDSSPDADFPKAEIECDYSISNTEVEIDDHCITETVISQSTEVEKSDEFDQVESNGVNENSSTDENVASTDEHDVSTDDHAEQESSDDVPDDKPAEVDTELGEQSDEVDEINVPLLQDSFEKSSSFEEENIEPQVQTEEFSENPESVLSDDVECDGKTEKVNDYSEQSALLVSSEADLFCVTPLDRGNEESDDAATPFEDSSPVSSPSTLPCLDLSTSPQDSVDDGAQTPMSDVAVCGGDDDNSDQLLSSMDDLSSQEEDKRSSYRSSFGDNYENHDIGHEESSDAKTEDEHQEISDVEVDEKAGDDVPEGSSTTDIENNDGFPVEDHHVDQDEVNQENVDVKAEDGHEAQVEDHQEITDVKNEDEDNSQSETPQISSESMYEKGDDESIHADVNVSDETECDQGPAEIKSVENKDEANESGIECDTLVTSYRQENVTENMVDVTENMVDVTDNTVDGTDNTEDSAEKTVDGAENTVDGTEDTVDVTEDTVDVTEDTVDVTEDTVDVTENTVDVTENTVDGTENTEDSAENTVDGTENTVDATENTVDATEHTKDSAENTVDGTENTVDGTENTVDGTENTVDGIENTEDGTENTEDGTENTEDGTENTEDGTENTEDGTENTEDGTENTEDGTENMEEGAENMEDVTENTVDGTDNTANGTDNTSDGTENTADAIENTADDTENTADGTENIHTITTTKYEEYTNGVDGNVVHREERYEVTVEQKGGIASESFGNPSESDGIVLMQRLNGSDKESSEESEEDPLSPNHHVMVNQSSVSYTTTTTTHVEQKLYQQTGGTWGGIETNQHPPSTDGAIQGNMASYYDDIKSDQHYDTNPDTVG